MSRPSRKRINPRPNNLSGIAQRSSKKSSTLPKPSETSNIRVLKEYGETARYLAKVRTNADRHKREFGFLPATAYEEQAFLGKLWVAIHQDDSLAGHLMFGGRFPTPRVFQLFVAEASRGQGVAKHLVESLVRQATDDGCRTISSRVATELPANRFWERAGFHVSRQIRREGKRTLNVRVIQLDTPALFEETPAELSFSPQPLLTTPSYAFDLNFLLDIIRKREHYDAAKQLLAAGFESEVRLLTTQEFVRELERTNRTTDDPLLDLARELPSLPDIDQTDLGPLLERLRPVVFRHRVALSENDRSDLRHLAACIHHRVTGFITRDAAILRAGTELRDRFGVEVASPTDFATEGDSSQEASIQVWGEDSRLEIRAAAESERRDLENFLEIAGVGDAIANTILSPGTKRRPRRRTSVWSGSQPLAVASWDCPSAFKSSIDLYVHVVAARTVSDRIIDHVLESALREATPSATKRIDLHFVADQQAVRETALKRGFSERPGLGSSRLAHASKVSTNTVLSEETWSNFVRSYLALTGLHLSDIMPTFKEFRNTGVLIEDRTSGKSRTISLFDFETQISPALVHFPKRPAVIVPIKQKYATGLIQTSAQRSLLPDSDVRLYSERCYFRKPTNLSLFLRNTLVFFYVSGSGGGEKSLTAFGRVTSSTTCSVEEALIRFTRQGVLGAAELRRSADANGRVHAFTFDNIHQLREFITYRELQQLGCVGGANLVTAQALNDEQLERLMARAGSFSERSHEEN